VRRNTHCVWIVTWRPSRRHISEPRLAARQAEDAVKRQPWGPEWWLYVLLALTVLIGIGLLVRFFLALEGG
jgi:hypothetical protein